MWFQTAVAQRAQAAVVSPHTPVASHFHSSCYFLWAILAPSLARASDPVEAEVEVCTGERGGLLECSSHLDCPAASSNTGDALCVKTEWSTRWNILPSVSLSLPLFLALPQFCHVGRKSIGICSSSGLCSLAGNITCYSAFLTFSAFLYEPVKFIKEKLTSWERWG